MHAQAIYFLGVCKMANGQQNVLTNHNHVGLTTGLGHKVATKADLSDLKTLRTKRKLLTTWIKLQA
jgi:hypothetical protein